MSMLDRYQAIQTLKSNGGCTDRGVNYARVIATYLYNETVTGKLQKIVFSLLFKTTFKIETGHNDHNEKPGPVIFYSCRFKNRQDYDYIPSKLREIVGINHLYVEAAESFSLGQVWHTLRQFKPAYRMVADYSTGFVNRVYSAFLVAKYRTSCQLIQHSKFLTDRHVLVTFCDAIPMDNLVTQLAKLAGLKTLTNQHGQYRMLDDTNMSQDAEAYANFISDQIFCWGGATAAEFSKFGINQNRCTVVGWIKRKSLQIIDCSKDPHGKFGVMLNGENGKISNHALIMAANKLASALKCEYLVRMHPANNIKEYENLVSGACISMNMFSSKEFFSQVDFSIAHMTGAIIESLEVGRVVYVLDDNKLAAVFRKPGLSYRNAETMLAAILADESDLESARSRLDILRQWYNDDDDQNNRVLSVLKLAVENKS